MSKKALGRGLSALIGDLNVDELIAKNSDIAMNPSNGAAEYESETHGFEKKNLVKQVDLTSIVSGKYQPRSIFVEQDLKDLAESIAKNGIIQPILVRQVGIKYEIIAGERRWRAAKLAGLEFIPVIVKDLGDQETLEVALVENVQRQDLNVIEEAQGYQRLIDEFSYTQESLAKTIGKSRSHVANLLRILSLPDEVREMVAVGKLSLGHAKVLINTPNSLEIAQQIAANDLSVRETEKLIKAKARHIERPRSFDFSHKKEKDRDIEAIEASLTSALGLKVLIENRKRGGAVSIEFDNLEQLDRIIQLLSGGRSGF